MIYFFILVGIVVLIAIVRVQNVRLEVGNEENKIHARARKIKAERARAQKRRLSEQTSVPEDGSGWFYQGGIDSSDGGFDGGSSGGGGGSSTHF